jgi:outer membrane protein assembly factor BamD
MKYLLLCLGFAIFSLSLQAQTPPKRSDLNTKNVDKIRFNPDPQYKLKRAYEFYENKDYQKAQILLEDLIPVFRGRPEVEKIMLTYAYTQFYTQSFTFAEYYFKQFQTTFPNSALAEEALYMSAESSFQQSPLYRLTQEDTDKALDGFQLFVNTYPNSERLPIVNQKMDRLRSKLEFKELENAKGYYQRHQYQAAVHTFKNLLIAYPDTKEVEFIRFMILKSLYHFAAKSVEEKQIERFAEAKNQYDFFRKKHPASTYLKEADRIAQNCDKKVKKLKKS